MVRTMMQGVVGPVGSAASAVDLPWPVLVVVAVAVVIVLVLGRRSRARPRRRPRVRPQTRTPAVGELWFAWVPFEDRPGGKDRPVLVLGVGHPACTVARLTSQDKSARRDHVRIPDGMPGLTRPSWVSLRPVQVQRSDLRRRLGDPGEALVAWYHGLMPRPNLPTKEG